MRKILLTGLVVLLPLAITLWVVQFIVNLLTRPFIDLMMSFIQMTSFPFVSETILRTLSQVIILVALFVFIWLFGLFGQWFLINALLKAGDRLLDKIPVVRTVYKTTKQIIDSLFTGDQRSFQQVVMVSFPCEGSFVLGLVTQIAKEGKDPLMTIFLPTTPNPTTGYLIFRPKSELIYLKMKTDEAIKYIVSCGVALPGEVE